MGKHKKSQGIPTEPEEPTMNASVEAKPIEVNIPGLGVFQEVGSDDYIANEEHRLSMLDDSDMNVKAKEAMPESATIVDNKNAPVVCERDKNGLIKGVDYVLKDGNRKVDWRAMIPAEYFVPNRMNFDRRNQKVPESIDGLADKDLLILLDGFKYIADLRGFDCVGYTVQSSPDHCTVVCSIYWLENFETGGQAKSFSGIGDANRLNTNGFGGKFLGPIAENRAFIRAVRNFLRIPVLGSDELPPPEKEEIKIAVNDLLSKLEQEMELKDITFEQIKNRLIKEKVSGAENFNSLKDLSNDLIFNMFERAKKKKVN